MQHCLGAPLVGGPGNPAAEDIVLEEGHRAGVLHGAGIELRDEQLVVLTERVGHPEVAVVETETLLGFGEESFSVHELRERGPAEDPQRNLTEVVDVHVVPAGVGTGHQRHQVGAHAGSGRKGVDRVVAVVLHAHRCPVGDHLPVRGGGDGDVEDRLEIGLVEAGEHALGIGCFELRVQVDLVVNRVDEAVQSLPGVRVAAVGFHDEHVVPFATDQRDTP